MKADFEGPGHLPDRLPMSSPPPDLLQGLLNDNLADLLEDMLPRDGQLNDCGPPSTSGELPSDGFLPSFLPQDFIGTSHGPNHQEMEQSIRCDTISTDPQGLRKRSGSGEYCYRIVLHKTSPHRQLAISSRSYIKKT